MKSITESNKNDFEKAKKELTGIIDGAGGEMLKLQIKFGKHLSPIQKMELKKELAPHVNNVNRTLKSFFPGTSIKTISIKGSK